MSLSNNFPTINPTLNLDFANVGRLDPRITFTRASTATYFDYAGVLRTAQNNIARFDYNPSTLAPQGLLIEEQRTNLLLQSQDFTTTWTLTGATLSANSATAPDGTVTAEKIIPDSGITVSNSSVAAFTRQDITKAASAITYSLSLFAKAGEFNAVRLFVRDNVTSANNAAVTISLVNGTVLTAAAAAGTFTNASATAVDAGNGWYRAVLTFTTGTETTIRCIYSVNDSSSTTGDGVKGIFIWGAQLEAGAFSTSYIPTTTTALTRSADVASMTGTNFSSWYNALQGTFVVTWDIYQFVAGVSLRFAVSDGTSSNQYRVRLRDTGTTQVRHDVTNAGVTTALGSPGVLATVNNEAFAYATNNYGGVLNGGAVSTAVSLTLPTVNQINLGGGVAGVNPLNGHLRSLTYYPTRLANAQLQALTG
jgi:hypothetical protein